MTTDIGKVRERLLSVFQNKIKTEVHFHGDCSVFTVSSGMGDTAEEARLTNTYEVGQAA